MKICVVGLGYIGLPTASMFADRGFEVLGVDVNPAVVDALRRGEVHIQEPGLAALVQSALRSGNLEVSLRPQAADIFLIAVPTPVQPPPEPSSGVPRADLSHVRRAAESLVPYIEPGALVILESTSPPGTTSALLRPILERSGLRASVDFGLAYCAERVLPGRILAELMENDRVIGGIDRASGERARDLYASFVRGAIHVTDATTAEMVKLMENTFRDVNIALANEFSRIAQAVGIDVHEAIDLANRHPRVSILQPGPGVGGHCIAVDPWFIVEAAPDVTPLIRTAREVNDCQPRVVADLVQEAGADLPDPVIAALGLAYKADVGDLRESASLEVISLLAAEGYTVRPHEPLAAALPDGTPLEPDLTAVLRGADVMVLLTDHGCYRRLEPSSSGPAGMRHKRLVDTRHCLDHDLWRSHGFAVHGLGAGRPACHEDPCSGQDEGRARLRRAV